MMWPKQNSIVIGQSQERECKKVGAYDSHFDTQISKLKKKANIRNCLL